ncbi:zinc ABC transporter substrate-binding protein [Micromonospora sp. CPCC 205371]|nr:zinc ABC transporter substrate-binding protein [Micromonospora sp. CPCC 205371]
MVRVPEPVRRLVAALSVLLFAGPLVACGRASAEGGDQAVRVVANFYPVEFLARLVGGDAVTVTGLTPAGAEPHDLALDGKAMAALADADVVLYLGAGFQPDVERAVAALPESVHRVDLLSAPGVGLLPAPAALGKEPLAGGNDPHVWLDPVRMKAMAAAVTDAYAAVDPGAGERYRANLAAAQGDLDGLDATLRGQLASCRQKTIVTSHAAFGYLADRYGLRQVPIAGLSPDAEPDAKTLAEITDVARAAGVGTVFFEEALPPKLAETVAAAIGARIDLLAALEFDPSEAIGAGQDYLSVMRANGQRLHAGLDCA